LLISSAAADQSRLVRGYSNKMSVFYRRILSFLFCGYFPVLFLQDSKAWEVFTSRVFALPWRPLRRAPLRRSSSTLPHQPSADVSGGVLSGAFCYPPSPLPPSLNSTRLWQESGREKRNQQRSRGGRALRGGRGTFLYGYGQKAYPPPAFLSLLLPPVYFPDLWFSFCRSPAVQQRVLVGAFSTPCATSFRLPCCLAPGVFISHLGQ